MFYEAITRAVDDAHGDPVDATRRFVEWFGAHMDYPDVLDELDALILSSGPTMKSVVAEVAAAKRDLDSAAAMLREKVDPRENPALSANLLNELAAKISPVVEQMVRDEIERWQQERG